jgi:hypothetical protein
MPSTTVVQLPDKEIVRRDNFVIAATVDGFLCYGTKLPLSVNCHRAVKLAFMEESVLQPDRSQQAEDSPPF